MSQHLHKLATAYPSTKFVSIRGDMCIANYPDKNIPTLLIYRKGHLVRQIVGMGGDVGFRGMKTSVTGESHPRYTEMECLWDGHTQTDCDSVTFSCLWLFAPPFLFFTQTDIEALLVMCDAVDPLLKVAPTEERRPRPDDDDEEDDIDDGRRNGKKSTGIRRTLGRNGRNGNNNDSDDDLDL